VAARILKLKAAASMWKPVSQMVDCEPSGWDLAMGATDDSLRELEGWMMVKRTRSESL
jgi:hypothetical protein